MQVQQAHDKIYDQYKSNMRRKIMNETSPWIERIKLYKNLNKQTLNFIYLFENDNYLRK